MLKKSPLIMSAHDLRHSLTDDVKEKCKSYERNNIHIILDNVVDAYNIGSAFRIADSIFAKKVWICGKNVTTPLDRQVQKSSVNTCDLIEWETIENTIDIFDKFNSHTAFVCLEKTDDYSNIKLDNLKTIHKNCIYNNEPLCLIVGSESHGINEKILFKCSYVVEIPMYGINNSMNVINALAIACSHLMY